ncbi:MAG: hypothetical protein ABH879_05580 [archaeon]
MNKHVSGLVTRYIEGDPTIRVGLMRGLIPSRCLTRHILSERRELRKNYDDVRNAVRRYAGQDAVDLRNVYSAFKDSNVDVKSNLTYIEVRQLNSLTQLPGILGRFDGNEFINIINSRNSIILIIPDNYIDAVVASIGRANISSVKDGICSITVHFDPSVKQTPGVYFLIMGQLSLNNINIYDICSCESEMTVYVEQKDGARVHQLLYDLSEYEKSFAG